MDEQLAHLGFSITSGIGPLRFNMLKSYFGSAIAAWNATEHQLSEIHLPKNCIESLKRTKTTVDLSNYINHLKTKEISVVAQSDPHFPKNLLLIPDCPIVLFVKGILPTEWAKAIGVVGTRMPTNYGRQITTSLCTDLVASGVLIISGLARGIDGIAHSIAVTYKKPTVAVLGCGVDIIYPPEHRKLYFDIISTGGAIISEVVPGKTVSKGLFPARNRIIAGLARGVVVTEGAQDSGSLITAKLAVDYNRDVFAVPGPVTSSMSQGPVFLLKQGAKLVTSAQDILDEYGLSTKIKKIDTEELLKDKTIEQRTVLELLLVESLTFDDLVRQTHLTAAKLGGIITALELSGILMSLEDGTISLV